MPGLELYRRLHNSLGGNVKKNESDLIMEETWWEDPNSRIAYIYDYYHDSEPLKLVKLNSSKDKEKIPIEIKFLKNESQTYSKDPVTVHIQLKPSQECNVWYYKECFEDRYDTIFPIGLYIDIPDEQGYFNRWLVVEKANYNNVVQFPTFEVLRCDKIIQCIIEGKRYSFPSVLRSMNSYNSGLWTDYKIETPEDVQKFATSLNRDTEKLFYNTRIIIDSNVLTEPRAWKISKINRISPNGIARITLAQDQFDQHRDYIEKDEYGNVIGMWADYWTEFKEPDIEQPTNISSIYSKISYSGLKPQIKIGGSYKKFTCTFYNNQEEIDFINGSWIFEIDGADASSIVTVLDPLNSSDLNSNQIKVKAPADDAYIGKILTIKYVSTTGIESSIDVEFIAL